MQQRKGNKRKQTTNLPALPPVINTDNINLEFGTLPMLAYLLRCYGQNYIRQIVVRALRELGLRYTIDNKGNVYSLIPNTPLVTCHLDQNYAGTYAESHKADHIPILLPSKDGPFFIGNGINLGGDDKNGVFICLSLLAQKELGPLSFAFCADEEIGTVGSQFLATVEAERLEEILYILAFDRRGSDDVLTGSGYYSMFASKEFEKALDELFKANPLFAHYKLNDRGGLSDIRHLSKYASGVNFSVGFNKEHQAKEWVDIKSVFIALRAAEHILSNLKQRFAPPVQKKANYSYSAPAYPAAGKKQYNGLMY